MRPELLGSPKQDMQYDIWMLIRFICGFIAVSRRTLLVSGCCPSIEFSFSCPPGPCYPFQLLDSYVSRSIPQATKQEQETTYDYVVVITGYKTLWGQILVLMSPSWHTTGHMVLNNFLLNEKLSKCSYGKLRQKLHLSPGVQCQPGQYPETYSQKNNVCAFCNCYLKPFLLISFSTPIDAGVQGSSLCRGVPVWLVSEGSQK